MKMTFRWYGDSDPVTLDHIRQIPNMTGIVSAIYDIPVGEVWPYEKIMELKNKIGKEFNKIEEEGSFKLPANKMSAPARCFCSKSVVLPKRLTQKLFGYSAAIEL